MQVQTPNKYFLEELQAMLIFAYDTLFSYIRIKGLISRKVLIILRQIHFALGGAPIRSFEVRWFGDPQ